MNKILVIGSNGQLGRCLYDRYEQYCAHNINVQYTKFSVKYDFIDIETIDITNKESVTNVLRGYKPDYIVNCAAYTNVPKAEIDVNAARAVNECGPKNLAKWCNEHDVKLIHVSTDYVYSNINVLIDETSIQQPLNTYGETKLHGDDAVIQENKENSIIIRTAWLYSTYGNNFMKTMCSLFNTENTNVKKDIKVVYDQIGSPTSANTLANVIFEIIKQSIENNEFKYGIYHCTDEGFISWYDFSQAILDIKSSYEKIDLRNFINIVPISTLDFNKSQIAQSKQVVDRPLISLLDKSKIKNTFNIEIPYWRYSLECVMSEFL